LGISKQGNTYLRRLLVHGARSVVRVSDYKMDELSRWVTNKKKTRGWNRACIALANKNARIVLTVV
jgi:transposase